MRYGLMLIAATLSAWAPNLDPVQWRLSAAPGQLILHATIAPDYKLYSLTKKRPGPMPLTITLDKPGWLQTGAPTQPNPEPALHGEVDFTIPYTAKRHIPASGAVVKARVRYQSCSDQICLPPATRTLEVKLLPANPVL